MVIDLVTILIGGIVIITIILFQKFNKNSKLPPGPWGWPILGHIPILGIEPWKKFLEWKKLYGPIVYVRFGAVPTVVLQSDAVIKQAFNQLTFSDRPRAEYFEEISRGFTGLIFAQGEDAIEQRQFLLRNLRDMGYGKKSMEQKIKDEIEEFIEKLEIDSNCAVNSKPISMKNRFTSSVANSFISIFMSRRFESGDPEFVKFDDAVQIALTSPGFLGEMSLFFPWLAAVTKRFATMLSAFSGLKKKKEGYEYVYSFAAKEIKFHQLTRVPNQPRDFIDAYLDKVDSTTDESSSFHKNRNFNDVVMGDILLGALHTTSVAMEWLVLYMIRNPKIQTMVYQEVISVVGHSRTPGLNDRPNLPFITAVISELLRITTFVPFGVFHATTEDVQLEGFVIPKGTLVYPNIYGVHLDEDVWPNPKTFDPQRFLEDGKLKKCEAYMPFSYGKRICPGLTQANDTMFLFFSSLIQRFEFQSETNILPSLEWIPGIICTPQPFKAKITLRA